MGIFHHKSQETQSAEHAEYDFANMVKTAREADPSRFKHIQNAFSKLKREQKKHISDQKH